MGETPVGSGSTSGTAAALRRQFDESFARPAALITERFEDLLAIGVGTDPYALHLSEIAGLQVDLRIVPVPSPAAQLLGIVAVRGAMAPIYDLAALLSYPPAANPRWIVFARGPHAVGFAFERFESHLRVPRASLAEGERKDLGVDVSGSLLRGTVRVAAALRPIIHMDSVVELIRGHKS
jgi:chemotaxis signal transduction protein